MTIDDRFVVPPPPIRKSKELSGCGKVKLYSSELETDQESTGSSEDTESPRSVVVTKSSSSRPSSSSSSWTPRKIAFVHTQVLRIREEESHLVEDTTGSREINNNNNKHPQQQQQLGYLVFSRPASPLGAGMPSSSSSSSSYTSVVD